MVLRRGADQCRAANVDVLDTNFVRSALRNDSLKWVQVHRNQIDRSYAMLRHLCDMLWQIAPPQDAAMNLRHQGLHPAVQDFGKARML